MSMPGYACTPYLHNHNSIELKESWANSKNVDDMYFVTATFSDETKPYFSLSNHYLLTKFKNNKKMLKDLDKFKQEKESFMFNMDDNLFERNVEGIMNFVSVYYLDYSDSDEDVGEVASVVSRREKVARAGVGHMDIVKDVTPKFTFPYNENIVVLEVSSEKSHQSVNKYCERTRRDVSRKGITMMNLVSFSVLEKLK